MKTDSQLQNDVMVELNGSPRHTDQDIAEAAFSAMKWDYEVPRGKVKAIVKDGTVPLGGNVWSWAENDESVRAALWVAQDS